MMGITLLTKEIKPKNIFYRNEVQYRDDVPLLYRKEIIYTLQPHFCMVDYRPVNVQCPNLTQDNTILMMVLEAVM